MSTIKKTMRKRRSLQMQWGLTKLKNHVFTIEEKCTGCNKCIAVCPSDCANQVYLAADGSRKVRVDSRYCIDCGACFRACDHQARDYRDDTERFFADLSGEAPVGVAAAPSLLTNFKEPGRLLGWLKSLGAAHIYDVSLGADIATWAMLRAMKEQNLDSVIAQPCPSVVKYCESYHPELLDYLAPVQSPLICLAIYLRKYRGFAGKLAFLSPCIAKSGEIEDANTGGLVQYNVTFAKLREKMARDGVDLSAFPVAGFEEKAAGIGHVYSRPGGLAETVRAVEPGLWIRQVDGARRTYAYLREYLERRARGEAVPAIVDILNCNGGCNQGTGTGRAPAVDDADAETNRRTLEKEKEQFRPAPEGVRYAINEYFDKTLDWRDFLRAYENRHVDAFFGDDGDLEEAFARLGKETPQSRQINCYACGYGECRRLAQAIKRGINVPSSCIDFERNRLKTDALTSLLNRIGLETETEHLLQANGAASSGHLSMLMMDLDDFKLVNDRFGHDTGDLALKAAAAAIRDTVRPSVAAGRWGGDEFMILLPDTDEKTAKAMAERIRDAVFRCEVLPKGEHITASIGVAEAHTGDRGTDLFRRADEALYEAKKRKPSKPEARRA
ncbi:MAG: diguanylate cyclase [Schwartzia sp.]|nr:diguanylate cyclase [Schwartzia sp. (in: firmicutes)]